MRGHLLDGSEIDFNTKDNLLANIKKQPAQIRAGCLELHCGN